MSHGERQPDPARRAADPSPAADAARPPSRPAADAARPPDAHRLPCARHLGHPRRRRPDLSILGVRPGSRTRRPGVARGIAQLLLALRRRPPAGNAARRGPRAPRLRRLRLHRLRQPAPGGHDAARHGRRRRDADPAGDRAGLRPLGAAGRLHGDRRDGPRRRGPRDARGDRPARRAARHRRASTRGPRRPSSSSPSSPRSSAGLRSPRRRRWRFDPSRPRPSPGRRSPSGRPSGPCATGSAASARTWSPAGERVVGRGDRAGHRPSARPGAGATRARRPCPAAPSAARSSWARRPASASRISCSTRPARARSASGCWRRGSATPTSTSSTGTGTARRRWSWATRERGSSRRWGPRCDAAGPASACPARSPSSRIRRAAPGRPRRACLDRAVRRLLRLCPRRGLPVQRPARQPPSARPGRRPPPPARRHAGRRLLGDRHAGHAPGRRGGGGDPRRPRPPARGGGPGRLCRDHRASAP